MYFPHVIWFLTRFIDICLYILCALCKSENKISLGICASVRIYQCEMIRGIIVCPTLQTAVVKLRKLWIFIKNIQCWPRRKNDNVGNVKAASDVSVISWNSRKVRVHVIVKAPRLNVTRGKKYRINLYPRFLPAKRWKIKNSQPVLKNFARSNGIV